MTSTRIEQLAAYAASAAPAWSLLPPARRAQLLAMIANRLEAAREELVALASEETGLNLTRLNGELTRTIVQARLFGDVAKRGEYLHVRIDEHDADFALGARPDLRRYLVPLGPVLNFAASNFPFAFSVFGGDTVSALAAGCPVIVKLHSGHPRLGARTAQIIQQALLEEGQPTGVFQTVSGQEAGVALLKDSRVRVGTFTGSTHVGMLLAKIAAERSTPIPFYGELGSVNPVFMLPGALTSDSEALAQGLAASVSASAGQLCTKPGFVFVPSHTEWSAGVAKALGTASAHRLLTPSISSAYENSIDAATTAGMTAVVQGGVNWQDDFAWVTPTLLQTDTTQLSARPELADEIFGPAAVIVEYDDVDEALAVATQLFPGNLTCTIHAAAEDAEDAERVITWGIEHAGRVLHGGWPTGVAVTGAQHHGGPWPATTDYRGTAVGTASIERFLRPVVLQDVPEHLRPAPVMDANPWNVPQARNADGSSLEWGASLAIVEG